MTQLVFNELNPLTWPGFHGQYPGECCSIYLDDPDEWFAIQIQYGGTDKPAATLFQMYGGPEKADGTVIGFVDAAVDGYLMLSDINPDTNRRLLPPFHWN